MSAPVLALDRAYGVRISGGIALVVRLADGVAVAALSPLEAVTVGLLDGARGEAETLDTLEAVAGEVGRRAARSCLKRLRPLLRVSPAPCPRDMPDLTRLASLGRPDRRRGCRTLPGPRVLHWWVTNACPRRCVYCFANPVHAGRTEAGLIARDRLAQLFGEAVSLGAQELLVAGGEPFLRTDLPEVLGDAIAAGLAPAITTKFPIDGALAARLARAGLRHLCLSVDSVRAETNRRLVGSASLAAQIEASVAAVTGAGIAFSIEFVATAFNHGEMEEVASWAAARGARVLLVVPFEPVLHPIGPHENAAMAVPPEAALNERIARLNARRPGITAEAFADLEARSDAPNCDIGKTKLFFGPFGRVHRCYKLLHDPGLYGPDLRRTSLAAAWHDGAFNGALLAPRRAYAESACGRCGGFEACHDDGRCIFQSQMDHRSYHDRDRACAGPH